MPTFAIDPEIRLRSPKYPVLRCIAEAVVFAREMAAEHPDSAWCGMLRSLERVSTEDDALEAAVELEGLLECEGLLVEYTEAPAGPVEDEQPPSRAVSLLFARAQAEPDR